MTTALDETLDETHDETGDAAHEGRSELALTLLLRLARHVYVDAVATQLYELGIDDMPRNGPLLLRGLADGRRPLDAIMRGLRVSKQAASKLIDTLVLRGYLVRGVDEEDRRRIRVELTPRGELAAATAAAAVAELDELLLEAVGPEDVETTRRTLLALVELTEHSHHHDEEE